MIFIKKRLYLIIIVFFTFSAIILTRFFYLQIIKHKQFVIMAKREYKRTLKEIMPRGKIYDINGNPLADSIVSWDVVVTTSNIPDKELYVLEDVLKIPKEKILRKLKPKTYYLKIKKGVDKETYDKLKGLTSILLEPHQTRIYPLGCATEIIGLSNENLGLSGIELLYDKHLKGNIIIKNITKDLKGNIIKSQEEELNEKPSDLYLTVEGDIQSAVEYIISQYFKTLECERIIAIVQNSKNGFISAIASYPPNRVNLIPVEYVYEPGSTFKTMILACGFEENIISENDLINCEEGKWKVSEKYTITDHEKLGIVNLKDAYAHSSNIGFGKIGLKIGIEKLYFYIKKFGFGYKQTDFPGESKGIIKDIKDYRELDVITTSYGYGISVNPIQLINSYTAIANKGELLKVHFLYKIKKHHNETEEVLAKREVIRRVISEKTAKRVIDMMINVVENGTGINAKINGFWIAGKTGTANKLDLKTKKYLQGQNVTSFCGFFPATDPQYTILIIVDNSKKFKYGGQTSAPIFKDIAQQIISIKSIKPDRPFEKTDNRKDLKVLN